MSADRLGVDVSSFSFAVAWLRDGQLFATDLIVANPKQDADHRLSQLFGLFESWLWERTWSLTDDLYVGIEEIPTVQNPRSQRPLVVAGGLVALACMQNQIPHRWVNNMRWKATLGVPTAPRKGVKNGREEQKAAVRLAVLARYPRFDADLAQDLYDAVGVATYLVEHPELCQKSTPAPSAPSRTAKRTRPSAAGAATSPTSSKRRGATRSPDSSAAAAPA